ncbi:MAG TPA: hypothetical protein PK723_05760 [Candidatus Pacearchaeota archaeon]|nr:hypothetical protein [Candidatus Pacearchaeota archaeon]
MFKVRGKWMGKEYEVIWDKGRLTGDFIIIKLIENEAESLEGIPVGFPTYVSSTYNHLKSGLSVLKIAYNVFDEIIEITGDVPTVPPVPEGGIA